MPVFHRSQRLQIYGGRVEVSQLFNSRFEIIVRCTANKDTEAWYNDNKSQIFADFGTLYSAQMSVEGIDPRTGEAYPNMVLVQNNAGYTRTGDYVVTFVYETLTDTFVQESQEKVDFELNGLRRVSRNVIAKSGSTYGKTVGESTITHTAHGYGSTTLTLSAAQEDALASDEGGFVRIRETWLESGVLNVSKSNLRDGIIQVETDFLVDEGAVVGPIVRRSVSDFSGLKKISVTSLQNIDGESILGSSASSTTSLVSHNSLNTFTYPGVVNLVERNISSRSYFRRDDITSFEFYLTPPTQSLIETTTFVFVQTSSSVTTADKTFNGASALYNPTEWASTYCSGIDANKNPFSKTEALRGYRALSNLDVNVAEPQSNFRGNFLVNGRPILNGNIANIGMKGGPSDPEGSSLILDVQITPAFETVDGVIGFKKKIVFATIPSRSISYVPEGALQIDDTFSSTKGRFSAGYGTELVAGTGSSSGEANSTAPELQLDLNKAPSSSSGFIHSTIATVQPDVANASNQSARVITAFNTSTKKATLSSALTSPASYTSSAVNGYTLYGFKRTGNISQAVSSSKYVLDRTALKFGRSSAFDDVFNNLDFTITAGTNSGETRTISDYDGATAEITLSSPLTLDSTSVYRIGPA
mgnify:FL=1|tara:strand:+ start:1102 stop:3033 length:1932 start_codon:yes stop_codon:yes gene_type:complete